MTTQDLVKRLKAGEAVEGYQLISKGEFRTKLRTVIRTILIEQTVFIIRTFADLDAVLVPVSVYDEYLELKRQASAKK